MPISDVQAFSAATSEPRCQTVGPWLHAGEWVVIIMAVGYFCLHTLPKAWLSTNTDFPNYYLTAKLTREGYATNRLYDWIWFQRQKDHMEIEQQVVGWEPNPPISSLLVAPLTYLSPLAAKRCWIVINLAMLGLAMVLLRSMSGLRWRDLGAFIALSFPVHRNIVYGQYYIALLLIFAGALWCYCRGEKYLSGALVALGWGLKLFPIIFLIYFVRRRDWRAVAGTIVGCLGLTALSLLIYGRELNLVYVREVLPWALRGEGMNPFNLAPASITAVLHRMLLFEPEWNPHPLVHSPILFAVLQPLLQLLILAPALVLSVPGNRSAVQIRLQWAAVLSATLAVSTMPASYHFVVLILPIAMLAGYMMRAKMYGWLACLTVLYIALNFPGWNSDVGDGWRALASVPRLYCVVGVAASSCMLLWRRNQKGAPAKGDLWIWSGALVACLVLAVAVNLQHQRGLYARYQERIAISQETLLATEPSADGEDVRLIEMEPDGYHLARKTGPDIRVDRTAVDTLAETGDGHDGWVEEASGGQSRIVRSKVEGETISAAEFPVAFEDGSRLAYLRADHGRSTLWLHRPGDSQANDKALTPAGMDVMEMSFLGPDSLIAAASERGTAPQLFLVRSGQEMRSLGSFAARYPAVSRDKRWLAFSRREGGHWNLWVEDLSNGGVHRVTDADCNDTFPSWGRNSTSIVYASDCGRAFGLSALYKLQVTP